MKKLGFRWVTAVAASVILLAAGACSDNDTETVYITNPTLQDLTVKPGDTGTIDFTATGNWTITTDSPEWLTLGSSTGAAGAQKVTYTVTEANIAFDKEDKAKVTLSADGGEFSCTITRAAKERTIAFSDIVESEESSTEEAAIEFATIKLSGDNYRGRVSVIANFDWKLKSCPDWVTPLLVGNESETIGGTADEKATLFFTLNEDQVTTTGREGEIVFTDASGTKFEKVLPIKFFGAEPTDISTTLPLQIRFSLDGHVYDANWTAVTEAEFVPFTVQAMENGYMILMFGDVEDDEGYTSFGPMDGYKSWIGCDEVTTRAAFATKSYELYVKRWPAPTAERTGYVAILPASVYAKLAAENSTADITDGLFDFGYDMATGTQTVTPNADYEEYLSKVIQDGPANMEIEITSAQAIQIEDLSASNGFTCYSVTAPTAATTVTITVKLPDENAGQLPDGMADADTPLKLEIKSQTWIPGTDGQDGHMEYSNIGEVVVTVKDGYSASSTEYTLEAVIPANEGEYRLAMSQITYVDEGGDPIGAIAFDQNAK